MRGAPDKKHSCLIDHGGNWWRWGSLNADRYWNLSDTGSYLAQRRADELREKKKPTPFRCLECGRIMMAGRCIGCGWVPITQLRARPVVGTDGELRMMSGDIFRARSVCRNARGPKIWERLFWAGRKHKTEWTFRQAALIFARENKWCWPSREWPFMPKIEDDWYRPISVVPFSDLIPKGESDGEARQTKKVRTERLLFGNSSQEDSGEAD